jgi:hypothetical protein
MWDSSSCEGLLYSCCIGVVILTFSNRITKMEYEFFNAVQINMVGNF